MVDLTRWNNPPTNSATIAKFGVFSNPERKQRDPNQSLNSAIEAMGKYSSSKGYTPPNVTINAADNAKGASLNQVLATLDTPFHPQVKDIPAPKGHLPRLGNGG